MTPRVMAFSLVCDKIKIDLKTDSSRNRYIAGKLSLQRILGFGACMIGGSPFDEGFLHLAVHKRSDLTIKSFAGFPVDRASRHLGKVLSKGIFDIVVVQFGAIDANIDLPVMARLRNGAKRSSLSATRPESPYSAKSRFRWLALDALALVSKHETSDIQVYNRSMEDMISQSEEHGAKVIVVSPFISGPRFKHKRAALYRDSLAEIVKRHPQTIFVDALRYLETFEKGKILMHNGFHLSQLGHEKVSELIEAHVVSG